MELVGNACLVRDVGAGYTDAEEDVEHGPAEACGETHDGGECLEKGWSGSTSRDA